MLDHLFGAHRFRASGLDRCAFNEDLDLARCIPMIGRCERKLERVADVHLHTDRKRNAWLASHIVKGCFGTAHPKDTITLAKRFFDLEHYPAARQCFKRIDLVDDVALVRPEFEHIPDLDTTALHVRDTPCKASAVVRTSITHDLVAALTFQIGCSETT